MGRYAAVLAMPLILGFLIAVTVLLVNELRERSQRRRTGVTSDDKNRRIAS